ncbi:MAG: hypothetical protein ACOY71_06120 [Gemmatimonadota bacterium]
MHFRTKDLLVTVLPQAGAQLANYCLLHTKICIQHTFCFHSCHYFFSHCQCTLSCRFATCFGFTCLGATCAGCSQFITGGGGGCNFANSCGAGGSACDPTQFCIGTDPFVLENIEDIVSLRAELTNTLKQLDELEKVGLPGALGSKAEAEAIEDSLTQALEQIRKAKEGLK